MTYSVASALSSFNAGQLSTAISISDSAADVVANLDSLEQLAAAGILASITLTDSGAPNLSISTTQATLDASVLNDIAGNFSVTQSATASNLVINGVLSAQGNTVVFSNPASQYTITPSGVGVAITSSSGSVQLNDIQAAQFSDSTVILAQTPGTIYTTTGNITELYGAVFGRLPDVAGLSFYDKVLAANPSIPLTTFAQYFLGSPEYTDNPAHDYAQTTAGDTQFIEDCYSNLLHRTPGAAEVSFYLDNVVTPMLKGLTPGTAAYSSAETLSHAYVLTYFSASPEFLSDVEVTAQNTPSAQHWLVLAPSYTLTHDGQASVTEGGTETFALTTSGVAANTVLYYSLSGVTASEVSGGALSGTITVSSKGTASLPVTLTGTAGQDLSGDLTVSLSASPGGATLASASEPLAETAAVAKSASVTDLGAWPLGSGSGSGTSNEPFGVNNSGQIIGGQSGQNGGQPVLLQNGVLTFLSSNGGEAWGINNSGQIAGDIFTNNGATAVIFQNGAITSLASSGLAYNFAYAINDAGAAVGQATSNEDNSDVSGSYAALWRNGTITDLGTLAGSSGYSEAHGINASDQVIGLSSTSSGLTHGFIWQNGTMSDLGTLAGATGESFALGINDAGQIVGASTTTGTADHAVLWQNGTITDLGAASGESSFARAINNSGQIVGYSFTGNITNGLPGPSICTAELWQNGAMTNLNSLLPANSGWVLEQANAISDSGLIVGIGTYDGVVSGFELTLSSAAITATTPTYTLTHDSQTSVTAGSTETFALTTTGVAANTTLYYTLSGVTAADVVGGTLSGTVTVSSAGTASLPVTLASTAEGLSGSLTASIATAQGGATVASASETLTETAVISSPVTAIAAITNPTGINDAGQVVGYVNPSGTQNFEAVLWQSGAALTNLGTLGGTETIASAINSAGEVVGLSYLSGTASFHAFTWNNGTLNDIGTLGGSYSAANGINSSGEVVGNSETSSGLQHAFLWQGKMTDLGTLGGSSSTAYAIDYSGQIVGWSDTSDGLRHGFIWQNGTMTDLGTLGGTTCIAVAIDNAGQVVGQSATSSGAEHAFLWQSGTMTDLGTFGGASSNAAAINASGQVVGQAMTGGGVEHAFLWQNGTMTDLNSLLPAGTGWVLTQAQAINDEGVVVGLGTYDGNQETFEFTVPSAASISPIAGLTVPTGVNASGDVVGYVNAGGTENFEAVLWQSGKGLTNLGTLGGTETVASAINSAGEVVGYSYLSGNVNSSQTFDAFLWENGTLTNLGTLGGGYSAANGINSSGDVVGVSAIGGGAQHAFLWESGKMTDLGTLGGTSSTAYTINSADQIVGWSDNSGGQRHGFLWQNGTMTDLGTLGGSSSMAVAIDNAGQVVGQSATSSGVEHAFLWQSGTMTDLGTLGGTSSNATAINMSGQVVGQSAISSGAEHAFLWQNGTMVDLNSLLPTGTGWVLTAADSISDKGVVVGTGTYFGVAETFEMTIPLTSVGTVGVVTAASSQMASLGPP